MLTTVCFVTANRLRLSKLMSPIVLTSSFNLELYSTGRKTSFSLTILLVGASFSKSPVTGLSSLILSLVSLIQSDKVDSRIDVIELVTSLVDFATVSRWESEYNAISFDSGTKGTGLMLDKWGFEFVSRCLRKF